MIKLLFLTLAILLLSGCANRRGISMKYYNDCREYYDLQGVHHKVCDENIVDYKDMFSEEEVKCEGRDCPNVW